MCILYVAFFLFYLFLPVTSVTQGAIGDLNPVAVTPKTSPVCNLYFVHLFFCRVFCIFTIIGVELTVGRKVP